MNARERNARRLGTPENSRKTGVLRGGHSSEIGKATQFKQAQTGNPGGLAIGDRLLTLREAAPKRGRKHISESRATEIRTRLAAWKQIPEPIRISLRALAAEMGTSHQLLAFYLRRWDKWQAKEYQRNANDIRARAEAEKRTLTGEEQAQVAAYGRAAVQSMINSVVPDILTALRKEARRGKLSRQHLRLAKILASKGYGREVERIFSGKRLRRPDVQESIKKNLPHRGNRFAKSFRFD